MRIAVLTLPLHTNYGGILQAYALQIILQRMGHEVDVLNRSMYIKVKRYSCKEYFIQIAKRIVRKYVLCDKNIDVFAENAFNRRYAIISQHTQKFIDRYIHDRIINDLNALKESDYDVYVVGSDQIWRPKYYNSIDSAYLSFARDWNHIKRIAYAPSFGTDEWEYNAEQTAICRDLIKRFDFISIRESDGVRLCKDYFDVEAEHAIDPTLLLEKSDYVNLVSQVKTQKSEGKLLVYVLDMTQEIEQTICKVAEYKHLSPNYVSSKVENSTAPLKERIQKPVEQWLRSFMETEFVITDSFHACVFAIIFNKPFAVLGNKERGMSRFGSLLKLFGLENRLVNTVEDINALADIDWENINIKRNNLKSYWIQKLQSQLQ